MCAKKNTVKIQFCCSNSMTPHWRDVVTRKPVTHRQIREEVVRGNERQQARGQVYNLPGNTRYWWIKPLGYPCLKTTIDDCTHSMAYWCQSLTVCWWIFSAVQIAKLHIARPWLMMYHLQNQCTRIVIIKLLCVEGPTWVSFLACGPTGTICWP